MANPGTSKRRLENSGDFESYDTWGAFSTPRLRNVQCEQIAITGVGAPAFVNSSIVPPVGVRAAILGVGVTFQVVMGINSYVALQMTRSGDPHLPSSDDAAGTYVAVLPAAWALAGQGPLTVPAPSPSAISLVTREGNGVNPLWRAQQLLAPLDTAVLSVLYCLFPAADITKC